MKIGILLPYKENFQKLNAGAVSLYVKEYIENSKYFKNIEVFGSGRSKNSFFKKLNSLNVNFTLISKSDLYLKKFLDKLKTNYYDLIEIHNRPYYLHYLSNKIKSKIIFYFHNDPLTMKGSQSINDRKKMIDRCEKIIFNSIYIKNIFFKNLNENLYKSKYDILYNSIKPLKKLPKKEKIITFVGKLNHSKGYDLFCSSMEIILNKFKNYKAISIGDERRRKIFFKHPSFKELGFLNHDKTLNLLKKTDIAVVPSRWDEPFGRTALEATSLGCYTISTLRGGLSESSDYLVPLKNLSVDNLNELISYAIINKDKKEKIQKKSFINLKHNLNINLKKIDKIRDLILLKQKNLRIINIYNRGEKLDFRIRNISIGNKLSRGFVLNGYDILEISDRLFTSEEKFSNHLLNVIKNYNPSLIIFGHSKYMTFKLIEKIKHDNSDIKIVEWNEDYLGKYGPDSKKNFSMLKNKEKYIDAYFVTTNPNFLIDRLKNSHYFSPPVDKKIEYLQQFKKKCEIDLFFSISHGVNRGTLKSGKIDERDKVARDLIQVNQISTNFFGVNEREPVWGESFMNELSKCKMGLNLSRGAPVSLYSSNRIAAYMGNGLLTFIHKDSGYSKFFNKNEIIFYKNYKDLKKKIIFYSKNNNLRIKIAKSGYLKYYKLFSAKSLAKKIINTLNLK